MTQAQKTAKEKFKKAIEYRKKTGVSLKEAFAHVYGKKVGAVKKAPIKKASSGKHVDTKSHNVNIKIVSGIKKKAKAKKPVVKKVAKRKVRKTYKVDYQTKTIQTKRGNNQDAKRKALAPGKRTSASGNTYYETRANRSDFSRKAMQGVGSMLSKAQEFKRLSQLSKTPLEKKIVSMIKYKLTGYDNLESLLKDILYNGLQSGIVSDLIYYKDTLAFYKKYKKEIDNLLKDTMNETGANSPADLFGNKWDKEDFFIEDTNNRNLLAWFGFEEKLRELTNNLGYEI
jgi:hypothetical protein